MMKFDFNDMPDDLEEIQAALNKCVSIFPKGCNLIQMRVHGRVLDKVKAMTDKTIELEGDETKVFKDSIFEFPYGQYSPIALLIGECIEASEADHRSAKKNKKTKVEAPTAEGEGS